jgi:hypothetical protein
MRLILAFHSFSSPRFSQAKQPGSANDDGAIMDEEA